MAIATSYGAFIAGEWVHGEGGSEIEVRSPYDDSLIGSVTPASEAQVDAAVAAAKAETGATAIKQMGLVMKAAQAKLAGKRIDGKMLSEKVKGGLS